MGLPREIGDAAQDGDRDSVMAWLDAGGSINDVDEDGYTLLHCCCCGDRDVEYECIINDRHVALARHLIDLGADVNIPTSEVDGYGAFTALHEVARKDDNRQAVLEMLSLLFRAGVNVNARDHNDHTPLFLAIPFPSALRTTIITELLRAGASLDACHGDETAEDIMQEKESKRPSLAENEHWLATKRLIAGVRKYGTFKRYMRAPHRDVLAVRGLAQRGKLSTNDPVLHFLARLGDNGVCWHILSFWRATN